MSSSLAGLGGNLLTGGALAAGWTMISSAIQNLPSAISSVTAGYLVYNSANEVNAATKDIFQCASSIANFVKDGVELGKNYYFGPVLFSVACAGSALYIIAIAVDRCFKAYATYRAAQVDPIACMHITNLGYPVYKQKKPLNPKMIQTVPTRDKSDTGIASLFQNQNPKENLKSTPTTARRNTSAPQVTRVPSTEKVKVIPVCPVPQKEPKQSQTPPPILALRPRRMTFK